MSYIADYAPLIAKKYMQRREKPKRILSRRWKNILAGILIVMSIISGIATYMALTETPPLGNDPDTVIWLLNIDLVLLLTLVALIARRIVSLWSGRKRKLAGSHLHVRLVYIFSLLAAVPVIIMTVFSAYFFHFGVQAWFGNRVLTAVNEAQAVAEAYLEEHKQVIRADTLAMAGDLDRQAGFLFGNEEAFEKIVQTQSVLRNLSEAIVFDGSGRILARSGLTFSLEFEEIPQFAMSQADYGDVTIMTGGNDDRVRALVKLNNFNDTYLFVGRMVDPQVLSHVVATKEAAEDYANLQDRYTDLRLSVTMIFVVVGLVLLMTAIWLGLILARQLIKPISTLINATDRVRSGDLSARVPELDKLEEFDYLARAFNRMTRQLEEQQGALLNANRQLDERRRLIETVLRGVSAGVIGVDVKGVINLANASAEELLGLKESGLTGQKIGDILPDITGLLEQAHERPNKTTQAEIPFVLADQTKRIFLIRIVIELVGEKDVGAILTFDDITELQSAQRKAAWADVARRIAHEIKNPLTPIQLSAERLRRKYLKQIDKDPETFSQCTDTIIKNVEDIGRMVNEFSSFARMPEPVMEKGNIIKHVEDSLILHKQANASISFDLQSRIEAPLYANYDPRQMRQALNNLIQNAVDSITARLENDERNASGKGSINIMVDKTAENDIVIAVQDNGQGLPKGENLVNLTEPYVTHKEKGTGLGLAIVKKIMEDHGGQIYLGAPEWLKLDEDSSDTQGAVVVMVLPGFRESGAISNDPHRAAAANI